MTDQLTKSIAHLCRVTFENDPWTKDDFRSWRGTSVDDILTILNAVASGELIPASDARLAVTEALRMAARVAGEAPYARDRMVCGCAECQGEWAEAAIRALADTDALAEVQKLRAEAVCLTVERDRLQAELTATLRREADTHARHDARAEAAEAKPAEREAQVARLREAQSDQDQAMKDAEAKVARLVEALEGALVWMPRVESHMQDGVTFKRDHAAYRAALSDIKEPKP